MNSVSHHLLLCATPTKALCCPDPDLGAASWARLKQLVREWGLEDPAREQGIVLRSKADCLRICANGPILLIWPDGVVYGEVTAERIEAILRQHVIGGEPIENWVVSRNQFTYPPPPARCDPLPIGPCPGRLASVPWIGSGPSANCQIHDTL